MKLDIDRSLAELAAKAKTARGRGEADDAQALEDCSRELQAAAQAYDDALNAGHGLLDRSANISKVLGRRVEGPRDDALVHTQERVTPALTRLTAALTRCAVLLGGTR